jgi:hypothetical protein
MMVAIITAQTFIIEINTDLSLQFFRLTFNLITATFTHITNVAITLLLIHLILSTLITVENITICN